MSGAKSPLKFSFRFVRIVALASMMLAASARGAQEPSSSASAATRASDCSKSTMTGDEFLNMLHTIVLHGDLRDVPFIEKTLGAKFNPTMIFKDSQPDEHNKMYDVTIPGINIWFSLHIMDGVQPLDKHGRPNKNIAVLNINGIYFKECSPITPTQIEKILSGNYIHKVSGARSIGGGIANDATMPEVGNNGMQVHVQYFVHFGKTEAEDGITLPQMRQTAVQSH